MIITLADLLNKLKLEALKHLEDEFSDIGHPGMTGDLYEGLTEEILSKSIFEGYDLRIVTGKVRNSKNELSGQIDCMLVVGQGVKLPRTKHFIYPSNQVIAVIEVKKNYYLADIGKSYELLSSVLEINREDDLLEYQNMILRDSYQNICRRRVPSTNEFNNLPVQLQQLYLMFAKEAIFPLRIVWGYYGLKSEYSLRESFYEYLQTKLSSIDNFIGGYSPMHFPNLIICENYSLLKANGMPFNGLIDHDDWWHFYVSTPDNPVRYFLELLWTRLDYMFNIQKNIFGDDLQIERLHPYIKGKFKETKIMAGWHYLYEDLSQQNLAAPFEHDLWEPIYLNPAEYNIMTRVVLKKNMIASIESLKEGSEEIDSVFDELINSIVYKNLVYLENGNLITLIESPILGSFQNRLFIAEGKTSRFLNWYKNKSDIKISLQIVT